MTTERPFIDIFDATVVATTRIGRITMTVYSNRMFHVHIPKFQKIDSSVIDHGYAFLDANGGGKYYNVYHFESFAEVEPEVREWAAAPENNNYTHSDAIVIGSISQKLITDFYVRVNKPVKPTKIFFSLKKAAEWSKMIRNKIGE